jgi:hypothetical protein
VDVLEGSDAWLYFMMPRMGERKRTRPFIYEQISLRAAEKERAVILCTRMRDVERKIPLSFTGSFARPIPPCDRIKNEIVAPNIHIRCVQCDVDHCQQ